MDTQAAIAQKQADIAQRQLAEAQAEGRAWVSINPFIGGATWDAEGLHIDFKFVMQNSGKLPALYVIRYASLETPFSKDRQPIVVLQKMMSDISQKSRMLEGFPLFPNVTQESLQSLLFSRNDITKYSELMTTFRPVGHPNAPPPAKIDDFIPMTLVYLVDYVNIGDGTHHQDWCIDEILSNEHPPLVLKLNADVAPGHLFLITQPVNCGAN